MVEQRICNAKAKCSIHLSGTESQPATGDLYVSHRKGQKLPSRRNLGREIRQELNGSLAERLIALVLKTSGTEKCPKVQILELPPTYIRDSGMKTFYDFEFSDINLVMNMQHAFK